MITNHKGNGLYNSEDLDRIGRLVRYDIDDRSIVQAQIKDDKIENSLLHPEMEKNYDFEGMVIIRIYKFTYMMDLTKDNDYIENFKEKINDFAQGVKYSIISSE